MTSLCFRLYMRMAKYGQKAQEKVAKTVREYQRGALHIGKSNKKVKSRKQAVAIGLSLARKAGGKVPRSSKNK